MDDDDDDQEMLALHNANYSLMWDILHPSEEITDPICIAVHHFIEHNHADLTVCDLKKTLGLQTFSFCSK